MDKVQETYDKLHKAGFDVKIRDTSFVVSLSNRSVNTMEVQHVLDYDKAVKLSRQGQTVVVTV